MAKKVWLAAADLGVEGPKKGDIYVEAVSVMEERDKVEYKN